MTKSKDKLPKPSRLIGPEDLRVGQYVTVAEYTWQVVYPSDDAPCGGVGVVPRINHVTGWPEGAGWPLLIVGVCLPYAFAETAAGKHVSLDLRRHRLSRLSRSYGRAVFEAVRKPEQPAAQPSAGS